MCGITGVFDIYGKYAIRRETLAAMVSTLEHRGPDEKAYFITSNVGFGIRRLSIIDVQNGHQPFFSEDESVCLICNGEIYNHRELRRELECKGYLFKTNCDVEVVLYLYLEYGTGFLHKLNGQFAFAISDSAKQLFFMARDPFGVCPLFYTLEQDVLIFGSEIKAILQHPLVKREVNLTGLDQTFSFPGLVSPATMFKGVHSLKPGYFLLVRKGTISIEEYWDLDYPDASHTYEDRSEGEYAEALEEALRRSISYRTQADVPVGFYLSGGLDSSLIGAVMKHVNPGMDYHSFSVGFSSAACKQMDERIYQRMVARHLQSTHHEIDFTLPRMIELLEQAVYFAECPLKETYNTCSLALSQLVREQGIKVILSGEGSDEFLGGYVGYRFDAQSSLTSRTKDVHELLEEEMNRKLWGTPDFFYEKNYHDFRDTTMAIYSEAVNGAYESFDCLPRLGINADKLAALLPFHKRSYLDLKLRLSDHLVSDHGDRTCYANSVEGRYPFLDLNLVECVKKIPPNVHLKGLVEKYILKKVAEKYLPAEVVHRQKFGFIAPGSPQLLRANSEWINDLLSYERIKKQGYFNPATVERLKKAYGKEGFELNIPFENDLLITVITFNVFLDVFRMPCL